MMTTLLALWPAGGYAQAAIDGLGVHNHQAFIVSGSDSWWVLDGPTGACIQLKGNGVNGFHHLSLGIPLVIDAGTAVNAQGLIAHDGGVDGLILDANEAGVASLIHHQQGVKATIRRFFPAAAAWQGVPAIDWHMISSPVSGQSILDFIPQEGAYDFYAWNEAEFMWVNFKQSAAFSEFNQGTAMNPGQGYLAAYEQTQELAFRGEVHAADLSYGPLSYSELGGGWHLLGNPYASGLDWNCSSWQRNGLNDEVHLWDRTRGNYISFQNGLGDFNGIIPPQQAVFVRMESDAKSASLEFPAAARVHLRGAPDKAGDVLPEKTLRLAVRPQGNSSLMDACFVGFSADALPGFDSRRDAHKLFGMGAAPMLYARKEDVPVGIAVFPPAGRQTVVPLWFLPGQNPDGNYRLELRGVDGFDAHDDLMLTDLHTGEMVNLHVRQSLDFQDTGRDDGMPRFLLTWGKQATDIHDEGHAEGQPWLYSHLNDIYVFIPEGRAEASLQVLGMDGRLHLHRWLYEGGWHRVGVSLPPGMYVVSLSGQGFGRRRKLPLGFVIKQ